MIDILNYICNLRETIWEEDIIRNIRRFFVPGHSCFLTHVTYRRRPILVDNFDLLVDAVARVRATERFTLLAWVVLPDHCHVLLNPGTCEVPTIVKRFKLSFAMSFLKRQGSKSGRTWHNRYWDHIIRDERDLTRHLDYIHYNPVKHGLALSPAEYENSSYQSYLKRGLYDSNWGVVDPIRFDGGFGE